MERVWDRFLTEQDKASLDIRPRRSWGFGTSPALVLIDLYRWVFGDSPEPLLSAIERWPGSCGLAGWNALSSIQSLLGTARKCNIPIVHITGLDHAGILGWSDQAGDSSGMDAEMAARKEHRFEIIDELSPLPGEAVLRKSSPSAFWGTPLAGHLNSLGIDTIIVAGESTSGCVRATVVDGRTYRYRVIVAEECVFDRHEAPHAINLFDMHQKYADVLPLVEIEEWLEKRSTQIVD